jgi:uncharacterized membrane protein YhaH (DUF805 family)
MWALFDFRGRLSRRAYLGWSLVAIALTTALAVALLMLGAILAVLHVDPKAGPRVLGIAMAVVTTLVALWTSLALAARRIRDIGQNPLAILGLYVGIVLLDGQILTRLTEVRFFWPFDAQTPVGALAGIALLLVLLLWPGADMRPAAGRPGGVREALP